MYLLRKRMLQSYLFRHKSISIRFLRPEIGLILKVAGIGLIVSVAAQILNKSGRDEQGLMLIIAGLIVVFFLLVGEMGDLFDRIIDVFEL